jgi:hypothetical protein
MYLCVSFMRHAKQPLFSCTALTDFTLWDVKYLSDGVALRNAVCVYVMLETNLHKLFILISGFKWLDFGERTPFNVTVDTSQSKASTSLVIMVAYFSLLFLCSIFPLIHSPFPLPSYPLPSDSVMTCINAFVPRISIKFTTGLSLHNDHSNQLYRLILSWTPRWRMANGLSIPLGLLSVSDQWLKFIHLISTGIFRSAEGCFSDGTWPSFFF